MAGEEPVLFDGLPEQGRPEGAGEAAPRLRRAERRQVELRPVSLEDLLPAEHRARFVWAFAEALDLSALYARIKAVEGAPGHPPADPRILVALWLYATVEGVGSARELARLCCEQIGFEWLCGGVGMNHKTLGDFRLAHAAVLERLLVDGFTAMLAAGQASLARVAQDGMRVRAAAGAASFRRRSSLEKLRAAAETEVARLRHEIETDPGAPSRRQQAQRERAATERRRRVEQALAVMDRLGGGDRQGPSGPLPPSSGGGGGAAGEGGAGIAAARRPAEPRVSTTDPEARVMKMADGGFRPAYNLGFACDPVSGMIAAVDLDDRGADAGKLVPMSDALARHYGQRPGEHLADGGFVVLADIETLAARGVTVFAPVPEPRAKGRDKHSPLASDPEAVAAWRVRMGSEAAKAVYAQRAATAECANAQVRNRGLLRFTVRGRVKAFAVALWHALAHNMVCAWRLARA